MVAQGKGIWGLSNSVGRRGSFYTSVVADSGLQDHISGTHPDEFFRGSNHIMPRHTTVRQFTLSVKS